MLGLIGGDDADVIAAVRWAAGFEVPDVPRNENPAKVVNLSLGAQSEPSQAFQDAVDELLDNPRVPGGTVVVVGAGNDNADAATFSPCNQDGVICVGAVGFSGARSGYSNFGANVDVMAPGGEMRETSTATAARTASSPPPTRRTARPSTPSSRAPACPPRTCPAWWR